MIGHERLLSMMVNTPILGHPRKAAIVFSVLRQKAGLAGITLPDIDAQAIDALGRPGSRADQFRGSQPEAGPGTFMRREPFRLDGGVAIINVLGSMVNRGGWIGDDGSGLYSYEGIKHQLSRVKQDSRAHSLILDIETPGGQATGAFEMAAAVREVAAVKPVYAVVNGMAASGGYALACGATQIITTPSGISGSIGVVMLHLDESERLADEGIKPTLIFAGAHKVDANGTEPLSDAVREELQAEVNATYDLFVSTVAKGRGDRLTKAKAKATEARMFMGKDAVTEGLADAVGTFEDVLSEAQARARKAQARSSNSGGKSAMSVLGNDDQNTNAGQQTTTAPNAAASADALAKAKAEGQKAANDRMAAILASDKVKGKESAAIALATGQPEMGADAVIAFVDTHVKAEAPTTTTNTAGTPDKGTIADRADKSGVNNVHGGPRHADPGREAGGQANSEDDRIAEGRKKAQERQQRQFEASQKRHGRR